MTTRLLLVIRFIVACFRLSANPWNFFQLNSPYFNEEKGIFSKMEINSFIPSKWRLKQIYADDNALPARFPVFLKPEWGQNSRGIIRINTPEHLHKARVSLARQKQRYLLQEAALAPNEFEIFYIRSRKKGSGYSNMSITEVKNSSNEPLPINGVHNPQTIYKDRTPDFSAAEKQLIWNHIKKIGPFGLARVSIRTDSKTDLLAGDFKIIEINLFLPMPLSLLDRGLSWSKKYALTQQTMIAAAQAVKEIPAHQRSKSIFFRKMSAHYKVKQWQHLEH